MSRGDHVIFTCNTIDNRTARSGEKRRSIIYGNICNMCDSGDICYSCYMCDRRNMSVRDVIRSAMENGMKRNEAEIAHA